MIVRRSAWRMWGWALAGIPLIVIALDVLTQQRLTTALRELLFRPEDTQLLEPRDTVWAAAMLIVGVLVTGFGLKELIAPAQVLRADSNGLTLRLRGPLRPAVTLSWDQVDDLGSARVDDDGDLLPVLWVRPIEPEALPQEPWGARWIDGQRLAILASDWDEDVDQLADRVIEVALSSAREGAVSQESSEEGG